MSCKSDDHELKKFVIAPTLITCLTFIPLYISQSLFHIIHLEIANGFFSVSMLSKFIIETRKRETVRLQIRGSKNVAWKGKSLANLKRLMPALELVFE